MTGKEKIQYITDVVRELYDGLISGNMFSFDTDMFNHEFVSNADIIYVLGKLAEQNNIKITETSLYKSPFASQLESQRNIVESHNLNGSIAQEQQADEKYDAIRFTIKVVNLPKSEVHTSENLERELGTATKSKHIELHTLEPEHYNKSSGVLSLSSTDKVKIAKRGSAVRKSNNKKYAQCWLMECVFSSVKTMKEGVHMAKILGVSRSKIGIDEIKKVTNIVQEINGKITEAGGPENLIKLQKKEVFVNNSYL